MWDPWLPEDVVAFFGQQHLPFRETEAKQTAHEERQRVGAVVDAPFRADLAAFVDRPLHLHIARGAGAIRSRQEMPHQPAAPVGAILRGVTTGHSPGSQHPRFSTLMVTPFLSGPSLSRGP